MFIMISRGSWISGIQLTGGLKDDNAGWHTQNTQIFYPAILTYEKLYGILFLIKIEII